MKIITILISDGFAGAEHVTHNLLENSINENILISNQEIASHFLNIKGLKVYNIGSFFTQSKISWPIRILSIRKKLNNLVKKEKPDLINLILEWSFLMSSNLIKTKIPIVISLHGEETKKYIAKSSKVANFYLEKHFKNSSRIISVGKQQIENLLEKYKKKTVVIPNGVDSNIFKPIKSIKQKKNVILFAGRFIDIKGIKEILSVAKQLPKYEFWFAGQGPLANLINLPNTKNLGFKSTEELIRLYNQATICIAPSHRESFGLVGLEAMSCQRAVIATPLGFSEYIENGKDGIIIPAKDEKALKDAIVRLMTNEKLRKRLEKNARKKALKYSWDKIAKQYLKVFKEVIKENNYNRWRQRDIYMKTIIKSIKEGLFYLSYKLLPDKIYLKIRYKRCFGKSLDLKNPKTLNEKLQWKKIYDKNPLYTICADKYKVRDYIKKKIGEKYLISLLFCTNNPKKINFDKIPLPFIIKSNHGSGHTIIIKNKRDINKKEIIKRCKKWLKLNYYIYSKEWQYKNIEPRVLIEKLLLYEKKEIPNDYKFHCFYGKVEFIQADKGRFGDHKRSFFNTSWELLPFTSGCKEKDKPAYEIDKNIKKPENLNKMIKIAEKLSRDFDYVRVDLYSVKNKIYFGELTFTHGGGFDPFLPQKYDEIFGDKLKLNGLKK